MTITQNPVTMEYSISFGDLYPGVGSSADPLCLPNYTTLMLPETGEKDPWAFYLTGGLLILSAAVLWLTGKRRKGAQVVTVKPPRV